MRYFPEDCRTVEDRECGSSCRKCPLGQQLAIGRDNKLHPVDTSSVRTRVVKAIEQEPDGSLRTIAALAGVSPETVRSVRTNMSKTAPSESATHLLEIVLPIRETEAAALEWGQDRALATKAEGDKLIAWLERTLVEEKDWRPLLGAVPISPRIRDLGRGTAALRTVESLRSVCRGSGQGKSLTFETILVETSPEGVVTVTLNRPEVMNAFNGAMESEFSQLWSEMRSDDGVRAIVLTAAGDRAFSTGVDVTERFDSDNPFVDQLQPWAEHEDPGRHLSPRRNEVWKPVIAAVHGMCAGGAFYWIADCDIVLCSPEATFFDPHVSYGLVAALEPIALRYRLPFSDVMRMALLGLHERMGAERALAAGLVTEIVARESLLARAQDLARIIAQQPPAAVQGTVKALWQSLDVTRAQALATGLLYTQVGNPIGTAQVDPKVGRPVTRIR